MTRDLVSRRIIEAGLRFLEREDARRANLRPIDRGEKSPFDVEDPARVAVREARLGRDGDVYAMARLRGESDLLPVAWLERGRIAARSVARIIARDRFGADQGLANGFLIGERLLLTCGQVLPSAAAAERSLAEFGAEVDADGRPLSPHIFSLEPESLFIRNEALDFTLVAVVERSFADGSLLQFGHLKLDPESGKVLLTERLTLIDHPGGLGKHVGMRTAKLVDVFSDYFHYLTDFEPAGAGAPVFSDQWEVVALHRCGIPRMDAKKRLLDRNGRGLEVGVEPAWAGGEGLRVSRICEALAAVAPAHELEAALLSDLGFEPTLPRAIASLPEKLVDEPTAVEPVEEPAATIEQSQDEEEVEVGETPAGIPQPIVTNERSEVAYEPEDADGYDPDFLSDDLPVFMPILAPEWSHDLLREEGGSSEIRGRRLSVSFDRVRRAPLVAAANLDGHTWEMPDDESGPFLADTRYAREDQPALSTLTHQNIDQLALIDARTLCCGFGAQVSGLEAGWLLNQILLQKRPGLGLWGALSLHWVKWVVSQQARANIYAGPILSPGEDLEHEGVLVAGELWKVVAWMQGDELKSAGYMLTPRNVLRTMDGEAGSWRMYRVSLAHLEELTGMDFGMLRRADELFERPIEHLPIRTKSDFTEPAL